MAAYTVSVTVTTHHVVHVEGAANESAAMDFVRGMDPRAVRSTEPRGTTTMVTTAVPAD